MSKKSKNSKGIDKRLSKLERKVAFNEPEVKEHTIAVTIGSLLVAGNTNYVPALLQAAGLGQRIANEVKMIGVRWRGRLRRDSLDTTTTTSVRLFLYYDLDAKPAVLPNLLNIFDAVTVYDQIRSDNRARYKLLYDEVFTMDISGPTGIHFDTGLKKFSYTQHFNSSLITAYQGRTLMWGIIPTASDPGEAPAIDSKIRMYYIDP